MHDRRLEESSRKPVTPFEKNLEVWRQLWRVLERSDIIVQVVDARNPLLYRCEDLENYIKDVDPHKLTVLLINKADFLTPTQRFGLACRAALLRGTDLLT